MIGQVRHRQRQELWLQGALLGLALGATLLLAAGYLAQASAGLGRALFILSPVSFAVGLLARGVFASLRVVGDDVRTARLIASRSPLLSRDVLTAVELERELGAGQGISEDLALAFVARTAERATQVSAAQIVDRRPTRTLALCCLGVVALCGLGVLWKPQSWRAGLGRALQTATSPELAPAREPITGDVELSYRYPAYTGLAPRTVPGTNGEVSAPPGTHVQLKTRSDREVGQAQVVVNGAEIPLQVSSARDLSGGFVVDKPGSYLFRFQSESGRQLAEGPPVALNVEVDAVPKVSVLSPKDELELEAGQALSLRFEASDDYGLSALELVYRARGKEGRVKLSHDEGRSTRGQHQWDITGLSLKPGDSVSYFLEAKDNDAVAGPKTGVSPTRTFKLYSSAEHRREALKRAEALWEKLVLHLADRMEGPDRAGQKVLEKVRAAAQTDTAGQALSQELSELAASMSREKDPISELWMALVNISDGVRQKVAATSGARGLFLRFSRPAGAEIDVGRRLTRTVEEEVAELEKDALYLESLIDRQKIEELRSLAQQLSSERRELSSLVEEYKRTEDPAMREEILSEVRQLREHLNELMQRMSELAKGIRDEHFNAEALDELMKEKDLSGGLDEVEKLLQEGKVDEALKKLQELSMQMDEMLADLDQAQDELGEEDYSEVSEQFGQFMEELNKTSEEQDQVAEQTRALRDEYRQKMRERLAQQAATLKDSLLQKAQAVAKDYREVERQAMGPRASMPLEQAQAELENLQAALKASDFDLAAESAARAERSSRELSDQGQQQARMDEVFQNPEEARAQSRQVAEKLKQDAAKVSEINDQLQQLFPSPGSMMSEQDRQKLKQLSREQRALEKKAQGLQQKMDQLSQMAPIFDPGALEQMEQVQQQMGDASRHMEGRDPGRGYGEQKGALEGLKGLQKQMEQSQNQGQGKGKRRGLPLPMYSGKRQGFGRDPSQDKVELPDADDFQSAKEFRKDLLDAMKQGAPDKYRDQVKRYYEELVK